MSIFSTLLLVFGISQVYWAWRGYSFAVKRIQSRRQLWMVCGTVLTVYVILYLMNLGPWRERGTPVHLTIRDALLAAPFLWWVVSSLFAFWVIILFAMARGFVG